MKATITYIRSRLNERSTWLLIGAAVTAGAALAWPWSLVSVIVGVIGAMVPDGTVADK